MIPGYCSCGRPAGRDGRCATCGAAERKAARAVKRPRVKIRKVSKKRAQQLREYTPLRAEYLLAHPVCEIRLEGCQIKSTDIHHTSTSDKDFLNVATWKGSCRQCHTIVETVLSAEKRREMGLLK